MKMWLKILFSAWFVLSIWYYLCQINHHCASTPMQQTSEKLKPISSSKDSLSTPEILLQNEEIEKKSQVYKKSEEEILAEKLKQIEDSDYLSSAFSFEMNETEVIVNTESDLLIQNILFYLEHLPSARIKLIGHTDSTGDQEINYRLGRWRAKNVKSFLIRKGLESGRIIIGSEGDVKPVDNNNTWEGRKRNRRVEIQFIH